MRVPLHIAALLAASCDGYSTGALARDIHDEPVPGERTCADPDRDADGHRSIACGGDDCDDLDPAVHPGAGTALPPWTIGLIARAGGIAQDTSLAIDPSGAAHVAFHGAREVVVASNRSGSWEIEPVHRSDQGTYVPVPGWSIALVAGEDGTRHLLYGINRELWYATGSASGWTPPVILRSTNALTWLVSLAATPDGSLVGAHLPYGDGDLAVSSVTAGAARSDAPLAAWNWLSLAVDRQGVAHLCYEARDQEWPRRGMHYATDRGGSWSTELLEGRACSLALDGADVPYVACTTLEGIQVSVRREDGWSTEQVDDRLGGTPAIALGPDGATHLAYAAGKIGHGELRYATNRVGHWEVETIDGPGAIGHVSLAVGDDGAVHIAYLSRWDEDWGDHIPRHSELRYATRSAAGPAGAGCP